MVIKMKSKLNNFTNVPTIYFYPYTLVTKFTGNLFMSQLVIYKWQ